MKKTLLFAAAMILSLAASAQKNLIKAPFESKLKAAPIAKIDKPITLSKETSAARKIYTPQGTPSWYTLGAYVYSMFGIYDAQGMAAKVYDNGNEIYVSSLFPGTLPDAYTKGVCSVDEKGDTLVTFDSKEIIGYYSSYELHVAEIIFDADDQPAGLKDLVMKKKNGVIYVDDSKDAPMRYIVLEAFQNGEDLGYLGLELCIELKPVTTPLNLVEVPKSATVEPYTFVYEDAYAAPQAKVGYVAKDGIKIYFNGLAEGTVEGVIVGNKVTIPTGQFLGASSYFLYSTAFDTNWEYDDDYNLIYSKLNAYGMTYDAETKAYVPTNSATYFGSMTTEGSIYDGGNGFKIEPFSGLKPAVPSDPYNLAVADYSDYDQYGLSSVVANVDENGKYIALENMEIAVYEDGDPLTFTSGDGYYIDSDITWIPYGWADNMGGYDLGYASTTPMLYLYETLFSELGLQVRYTVDGVTNYSNIVYCDVETGDNRTEEVDHATGVVTGITTLTSAPASSNVAYNLAGQQVDNGFKGIVIRGGKKYVVK